MRPRRLVWLAVIVSAVGWCDETVEWPLELARGQGCWFDAQSARVLPAVWAADAEGAIAIEAERPSRYFCDPKARGANDPMPEDEAASGGAYIDAVSYARYDFVVDKPATYTVWVRVATPKGRSSFRHYVDRRAYTGWFMEDNKKSAAPWHWVGRGRVHLNAGLHAWEMLSYAYRFPAVDKWVLSPNKDWKPDGVGPKGAGRVNDGGWVETSELQLPGLRELALPQNWPAPGVSAQVSVDDGRSWLRLGDAIAHVVRDKPLRFRFSLSGQAKIDGLSLRARVADNSLIDLNDGQTRIVLDRETGGLMLIANARSGQVIANPGRPRPLFDVDLKKTGEASWTRLSQEGVVSLTAVQQAGRWTRKAGKLRPNRVRADSVSRDGDRVEVSYTLSAPGVGRAAVHYRIAPHPDGGWQWSIITRCLQGPADVTGVGFPILEHVRLGRSGLDDHQLRVQSFGHHALQPGKGPIRDDRYIGSTVMPWTEVYDDEGGFYCGSHDPRAITLEFESKAGGLAAEHFTLSQRKLDDIHPGQQRAYEFRLAAHAPTWHWGADCYRKWFHATFGRAEYPPWLQNCDGWVGLEAENYGRSFRFAQMPDWLTRSQSVGIDWVQVWGQFAYDGGPCCSNFYALSPLYGGEEGWREACAAIRNRGGHVGAYFLYHGLDMLPLVTDFFLGHFRRDQYPQTTSWFKPEFFQRVRLVSDPSNAEPPFPPPQEEIDKRLAQIAEHAKLYESGQRARPVNWWQGTYVNDPTWIHYLKSWIVDTYQRRDHNDACYMDVLGTGRAPLSYDRRRGHNGDGEYGVGRLKIARTIVTEARKANPDYVATMEGMGDLPGRYCASMCSGVYRGARNVMRYTFPERIFIHGNANHGSGGGTLDRFLTTFLEGMRYDSQGRYGACAVYLMQLQRQFTPWLYRARFLDTVGVRVSTPSIRVRAFGVNSGPARGALLTVVNRPGVEGEVIIDETKLTQVRSAFFVDVNGRAGKLALQHAGGAVRLRAPTALASILFLARQGQSVYPLAHLNRAGSPQWVVTLLNPTAQPQRGTCRVENLGFTPPFGDRLAMAREALPLVKQELPFDIPAGEVQHLAFPVRSPSHHWWTVRLAVTCRVEDSPAVRREFLATPLALGGSWELLGGTEGVAADGARSLRLGPTTTGYQHALPNLWLEPEHRYRVSVRQRRDGFRADVRGVRFNLWNNDGTQWYKHLHADARRLNEWQTLTCEFTTAREFTRAAVYLYNVRSPHTAWFDQLQVEDLGSAEGNG